MVKITLFGGTGMTGVCALKHCVAAGYEVTLLVRDESKLPDEYRGKVRLIKGDVLNIEDVKKAVDGADSVVVALGTRNDLSPTTVMSEGLKNILSAMGTCGVRTVSVCLSAFLFYEPDKVPQIFMNVDKEHRTMLQILKDCDRDWIAVLPPHIADEPDSEIKIAYDEHPGTRVISKYSLGKFLVESTLTKDHIKKVVGVAKKTSS